MMHHPNMHHQAMSGHPSQHMPGPQPMPTHHQIPHQMHRENRVPLGPSQAGGGMGAHGQAMGGMGPGGMGVPHHGGPQRAPHPIRAMPHHPPGQHHSVPPPMKALRRPYGVGAVYGANAAGVMPQYAQPPPPLQPPPTPQPSHTSLCRPSSPTLVNQMNITSDFVTTASTASTNIPSSKCGEASEGVGVGVGGAEGGAGDGAGEVAAGGGEAARPAAANSKEKTPMCLVNELARYNKIKHQYRLTSETGPAHKKVFTVTLRLGDTEEYTAEGSSIKRAQHAAASAALGGTRYPPPPPRAPPAHQPHQPHHRHSVMPTVELNALAMKLCQPAIYTSIPPVAAGGGHAARMHAPRPYRMHAPFPGAAARMIGPGLVYRVRVCVGGRAWLGEGGTPQAARHDAAARALHDLRPSQPAARPLDAPSDSTPPDTDGGGEPATDLLSSEVKSPVSLVHELALKRNLAVTFTVKSERGPPHMRVFVTQCAVGELETEGEGNGKKVSKRRAAERMLDEMRRRWPPALLRARPPLALDKRRQHAAKKKPRNLIKEGGGRSSSANGSATGGEAGADNPISRLAVARHAMRARSPQYRVVEERGAARRREFLVQCDAPPHSATGLGPNKKTAKRRAAHNVLLAMEMSANPNEASATNGPGAAPVADAQSHVTNGNKSNGEKRKEAEPSSGAANGELRQPVPGVLMMDYHQRPPPPAGSPPTGTPGAKDQLLYLSQLLGFTVQFSDFPKRNHGEYLSLVSLSTTPPVMCHGGGPSTAHSHEQCSLSALQSLKNMGLDAPTTGAQTTPSAAAKQTAIVNGVAE